MSGYIPDEIIERIRDVADIVDVASSYIQVKRAGSNRFKALCPFHNEKTPSFHLNQERQAYHCFGCGKGGDVFSFIMEKENVDFPDAVRLLADKYAIVIPETFDNRGGSVQVRPKGPRKDRLFKVNDATSKFFAETLAANPASSVAAYLKERGLPPEIIAEFRIGAAPDDWHALQNHLSGLGFARDEMVAAGVLVENESGNIYDRFRNRLMFTITDEQGRVVGFSGRSVEKDPQGGKYVNTPETPLFKKSRILYALSLAREAIKELGYVILCEGQMDAIALHRAGFKNAVAPQGTAFTDEQARMLKRYTDKVRIAFDSDGAGVKAALRAIEIMLPIGFDIQVVNMPLGADPDQIFSESGVEGVGRIVDAAVDFFDFALEKAKSENDPATPWGKSAVVDKMLGLIGRITKDVMRAEYASKLAVDLQLPESAVFTELNKNKRRNAVKSAMADRRSQEKERRMEEAAGEGVEMPASPVDALPPNIVQAESYLLELALAHGTVGRELADELPTEMISDTPLGRALNLVISMTLNGEWELAEEEVRKILSETSDSALSKVLAAPELDADDSDASLERRRKALEDCVRRVKTRFVKNELKVLKERLASGEAAENVLIAYREKLKALKELEPRERRLKPRKRVGSSDEDARGGDGSSSEKGPRALEEPSGADASGSDAAPF